MSDTAASNVKRAPGWQLLADFAVADLPAGNRPRLDPVMEAVQGLDLQPVQLETIHQALEQAVARAMGRGEAAALDRLRIHIWVLGGCASGRGWGFFLVDKGADPQRTHTDTDPFVDLFLYQECDG